MLNIPEFTVSELSKSLKNTLEEKYSRVRVRGEISSFKKASSGHMYLSLKDENSIIDAIIWRSGLNSSNILPEDGLEVIANGRITTYAPRSRYQIIIDSLEIAGEGALLKLVEERKKRLAKDGFFDSQKKLPLPMLPSNIGIITSESGAALQDMLKIINDRFPSRVILWPTLVQGKNADKQIAKAIQGFNNISNYKNKPDVIIIGRGGGSIEDLMAFNSEEIVYAIFNSTIPLISAVGHETDNSLSDLAADFRAATPTAAAEMVVPLRSLLYEEIIGIQHRLILSSNRIISNKKKELIICSKSLGGPERLLELIIQKIDHLSYKLKQSTVGLLEINKLKLSNMKIKNPKYIITNFSKNMSKIESTLINNIKNFIKFKKNSYNMSSIILEAQSYERLLKKGFAILKNKNGKLVAKRKEINLGDKLDIILIDGQLEAEVKKIKK